MVGNVLAAVEVQQTTLVYDGQAAKTAAATRPTRASPHCRIYCSSDPSQASTTPGVKNKEPPSMARFPSRVEDLSPALLSEVLGERHPGVEVASFEVIKTSQCGDGFASTADHSRAS